MTTWIPYKVGRRGIVQDDLQRLACLPGEQARAYAAAIPDLFIFHAVFVEPRKLELSIIDRKHLFLEFGEHTFFLGSWNSSTCEVTTVIGPWRDTEVCSMSDDAMRAFDIGKFISERYSKTLHQAGFGRYLNASSRLTVDITRGLKEFVGDEDE